MKPPSSNYGLGALSGFTCTIAVIALVAVISPTGLVSAAVDVAGQGVGRYISFGIFGFIGSVALLVETNRE